MEYLICNDDRSTIEIYHFGIKGQKWGIRRFQDARGRLTDEGKRRYGSKPTKYGKMKKQSDKRMERLYKKANDKKVQKEALDEFNKDYYKLANKEKKY